MNDAPDGLQPFADRGIGKKLGSLSQSARKQTLRGARSILLFIGIMTIGGNAVFLAMAKDEVDTVVRNQLQEEGIPEAKADHAKVEQFRTVVLHITQAIYGGAIGLGVIFVLLGSFIYKKPVAITVTGLVLYIAFNIIFGLLNPASLVSGIVIKIIIIIAMAKAISAAVAYQREQAGVVLA